LDLGRVRVVPQDITVRNLPVGGAAPMPVAAHADWSIDPRKRWVAIATPTDSGWRLEPPGLVGDVTDFMSRLQALSPTRMVALGLDVPIGIPRAYAATRTERDFQDFLCRTKDWPDFYRVCSTLDDVAAERPFYPARGIAGMTRASHALALGLDGGGGALSRACDRATAERPAGAPVFWTLGANQSGKAAIAAWRDMLIPALDASDTIRLWPFAGPFLSLLTPGAIAIAETYPAEALRHLTIKLKGSKRRQSDRAGVADALFQAMGRLAVTPTATMRATVLDGFGPTQNGEDQFDCTLGVLYVINVLLGNRPDTAPEDPWLHRWEGWVLGQTSLPLNPATIRAEPAQIRKTRRPA
jgi:hypothetical protein